jgi:hypothetical protein
MGRRDGGSTWRGCWSCAEAQDVAARILPRQRKTRPGFLNNRPALLIKSLNMAAAETRTPPEGREAAPAGFLDLDLRKSGRLVNNHSSRKFLRTFSWVSWTHSHSRRPVPRVFALVEVQKERCR